MKAQEKLTKIVATISDRKCEDEFLKELFDAGVNVVRLNTAHQTEEDSLRVVEAVRRVNPNIPLLLDTKGPEIRTTKGNETISLSAGDTVRVKGNATKESSKEVLYVSYEGFVTDVPVGKEILIDDGELSLRVDEKTDNSLVCTVLNDGEISGKKSVNIPGVHVNLPSLSEKDKSFIEFAIKHDLDFIAHSFVRNKEDVISIQKMLDEKDSKVKIIAKIENEEGVNNLNEILDYAYGVMVARGDLGIEVPAARIPGIQKQMIKTCMQRNKPVITATQMLHTMIKNPRPTRAEVSDIANAIYDGTDAVMLSGETAYGNYPVEAVKVMNSVAREVEENMEGYNNTAEEHAACERHGFLTKSAVRSTLHLPIKALIIDTIHGTTARRLSTFRGKKPIYAQCSEPRVTRELALSFGIIPVPVERMTTTESFVKNAVTGLFEKGILAEEDMITILGGNFRTGKEADFMEITQVKGWIQ